MCIPILVTLLILMIEGTWCYIKNIAMISRFYVATRNINSMAPSPLDFTVVIVILHTFTFFS